ncbi:hypothetical protein VNO77_23471 [Canavalia gladiata]|uniref:Uncharacterized protein n=1 Tax=Canavalia gladiata TaxID=3824 RepID=A0AAN9QBJ2_CANGL
MILGSMMLESCLIDHLKITNNVKCYSNGGVNHRKNGKIKTESEHPGAKNNDESQPRIWMNRLEAKPLSVNSLKPS